MFILDSLIVSGLRWVLDTVSTAADAEMNDDTALREALLAAELRREMGEISDEEFAAIESDLLTRIREIKERREGPSRPLAFEAGAAAGGELQVEATVSGDFHEPRHADSGTVIEGTLLDEPPPRATRRTPGAARPARTGRRGKLPRS